MVYCSVADIESRTGYSEADFITGGVRMTESQWTAYVDQLIAEASGWIDRTCRRTFASAAYVEYRDGKGADHLTYRLHEQPVTAVTTVEEDTNTTGIPAWTARTARTALVAGDYKVLVQSGLTSIVFHNNSPAAGTGNVRITYTAGYLTTDPVYLHIKGICEQIVENALLRKKKIQESTAARTGSAKDAADMIPFTDHTVITAWIREQLAPYTRNTVRRP
jgi:hypothetical protein